VDDELTHAGRERFPSVQYRFIQRLAPPGTPAALEGATASYFNANDIFPFLVYLPS
jgi:hypothetical protein